MAGAFLKLMWCLSVWVLCACQVEGALRGVELSWDNDFDGIHDGIEMELARKFAPVVHYHKGEHFFPADVATFLNYSRLFFRSAEIAPDCEVFLAPSAPLPILRVLRSRNALRGSMINVEVEAALTSLDSTSCESSTLRCSTVEYPLLVERRQSVECVHTLKRADVGGGGVDSTAKEASFYLEVGPDFVNRLVPRLDESAPVYVHVFPTINKIFPPESITIQYWFFYPFHGPVQTFVAAGAHEGDWEHVTVVVHNQTHEVLGIYMAEHSHEAFWLAKQDVSMTGTHVHVFPAMLTHAFYESPGQHRRARAEGLGVVVDYSSESDEEGMWLPHNLVNMGERHFPMKGASWLSYNGYWGSKRVKYSHTPLLLDTGSVPLGPAYQDDYWVLY